MKLSVHYWYLGPQYLCKVGALVPDFLPLRAVGRHLQGKLRHEQVGTDRRALGIHACHLLALAEVNLEGQGEAGIKH